MSESKGGVDVDCAEVYARSVEQGVRARRRSAKDLDKREREQWQAIKHARTTRE